MAHNAINWKVGIQGIVYYDPLLLELGQISDFLIDCGPVAGIDVDDVGITLFILGIRGFTSIVDAYIASLGTAEIALTQDRMQ